MATYSSFLNTQGFTGDFVQTGDVTAVGDVDFSSATLIGFPVDNISIFVNDGVLSSVGGSFETEFVNEIFPFSGNTVTVAGLSGQTLITNNFHDNALSSNQVVITNSSGDLSGINLTNGEILIGSTSLAPVVTTITPGTDITITNGAGSISVGLTNNSLNVNSGTGLTGGGSVILGGSTTLSLSTPVSVSNGGTGVITGPANGDLLIGDVVGGIPGYTVNNLTPGNDIIVTNGPGTITVATDATSSNTVSTIVKRDGGGNFSAGIITASLNGNATTATTSTNFSGSLTGDVTGTQSATIVSTVGGASASSVATAITTVNNATSLDTSSTLIKRDSGGGFAAGIGQLTLLLTNGLTAGSTKYSTGTASQTGFTITGSGTTWTSTMLYGLWVPNSSGNPVLISAFTNGTTLTAAFSQSVSSTSYTIFYVGTQIDNGGDMGVENLFVHKTINLPASSITNADLVNSSLTVSAGTGLTGGGSVNLGGSTTLSLSTPVSVANGGSGTGSTPSNGQLLIGNGTNYSLGTLTGTTSQINVTNGAGTITLATPQNIDTSSTPTFGGLGINGTLNGTIGSFTQGVSVNTNNSSGVGLNLGNNTVSYSAALLNYYEETTQSMNASGAVGTSGITTIVIRRIGKLVIVTWPQINFSATSSAALTLSTIPTRFHTAAAFDSVQLISNNGTNAAGFVQLLTGGTMEWFINPAGGVFTNATACIIYGGTLCYSA